MKILSTLLIAQVLLTLFVIGKLIDIDSRIDKYETAAGRPTAAVIDPVDSRSVLAPNATSRLSEEELRQIIREELVAHSPTSAQPVAEEHGDSSSKTVDAPDYQYLFERVSQELDYYELVGEISKMEMEELQADIASLQASDRQHMFNRLTQSMNAGRIKGLLD
jgi:hypothetical protein